MIDFSHSFLNTFLVSLLSHHVRKMTQMMQKSGLHGMQIAKG
jgi:hypothetical protein